MNGTLNYKNLEINDNKCRYSFEDENNDYESLAEHLNCHEYLKDILKKPEEAEINYIKEKTKNLDIKEQILLNSLYEISSEIIKDESQIVLFNTSSNNDGDISDKNISETIYNTISRMVHKSLHKKKMVNGKEVKECIFYDSLNQQLESDINIRNNNIEKLIHSLKEQNKSFEFIAIKSIMISITNLMTELIQNYLVKINKLIMIDDNKGDNSIDYEEVEKDEFNIIEANIFEDIYKDFVSKSNLCSFELEEFFKLSLGIFKEKYQMNFTLSELFTDIFWNSIFHNKKLCSLYINSYLNDDIYGDAKKYLKIIAKIILKVNIPLKHQIVELLNVHQLEAKEKTDLMTLIESQKKNYHWEITKSEREKEKEKEKINKLNYMKKSEELKLNLNSNNNDKIIDKNIEKNSNSINNNNIMTDNNIKFNVITANDISVIKPKKQKQIITETKTTILNSSIIKESNKEKTKENKEKKEKEENYKKYLKKNNDSDSDMDHKTIDEIYNYINGDKIVKNKRKKKSRKNKKAKREESIVEENQEEIEDIIVLQFKEDLKDKLIHARNITKIRPCISEKWIKDISSNN
jgi:hypothetical protein